ncbi:hypothetical protein FOXG_10247 [Fusarium oxysporum f. sp. lycopersici 4287]|uniref:Zn(2)-C6 fungal-type domain-containing protein n=2 Tax=Fusarium oxysporum TaxID=5507 RepID=A0A0J9VEH4_FUSO4|nr:hypothetical protein FOXG_10247 [Fusarium oxysporum f. sp. lycopersici 4287]EXK27748.1 hypothetical protein FOMG_15971 [Fusarium oxysporum f. sp. melonis 26406]KNB09729.1 hypothetical protein FOXG_10247 [Fusarium oxysporum f. sp. lycopersici 4287]
MDQGGARAIEPVGLVTPRRLLRKGTHSCVECKRRKARCFFDHPSATTCVGCQRRGSHCVGQEFVDIAVPKPEEDPRTLESLKRIEQMLERLTVKVFTDSPGTQHDASQSQFFVPQLLAECPIARDDWQDARINLRRVPVPGVVTDTALSQVTSDNTIAAPVVPIQTGSGSPVEDATKSSDFILPEFADTCRTLHAALPSQQDANVLFGAGRAAIYLQLLCNPYSQLFDQGDWLPPSILSILPPITAHPVLLARKFLQLCLCIQQLDPSFNQGSLHLGVGANEAMRRYYYLASSMVTCHDQLLDSLEGLECLIFEGAYLINCGNLRRALISLRRASTLAQFMGLHRKARHGALKQHDPATRVSGDVAWAHIAYLERYLSLLLDMSTSITNAKFSSEEKMAGQTDAEWLENVQIDICEQIINRNQRGDYNLADTQRIDNLMNKIANSIPSNWWAPMNIRPDMSGDDVMSLVVNAQMQIVHYNLLTVLHLPYLLRKKDPDHRYDYNKTVCTYASRQVLSRYIPFRSIVRIVFCCRIVDFCALTASLTLLLAHLSGQSQDSTWLLTHQRLEDRALIEKTIDTLDELNRLNNDELTRETAKLARKLLALEADSAESGDTYSCGIVKETQDGNDVGQGKRSFYLAIPYFGNVRLAPDVSPTRWPDPSPSTTQTDYSYTTLTSAITTRLDSSASFERTSMSSHIASSQSSDIVLQPTQQQLQRLRISDEGHISPICTLTTAHQNQELETFDLPMPDVMADAAYWAFQGVDAAFFNSLINGQVADPDAWNSSWCENGR